MKDFIKKILFLFVPIFLIFVSCQKKEISISPIIAQVGKKPLTIKQIEMMTPPLPEAEKKKFQENFVDKWIRNELLMHYIHDQKISLDSVDQMLIEQYTQQLLIKKLTENLLKSSIHITESDIQNYYENHKEEFKRLEDEVHFIMLRLEKRNIGIEDDIKYSQSLMDVIKKNYLDKKLPEQLEVNGDQGYVPVSKIKKEILRAIRKTPIGKISRRIRTPYGYYYVQVLDYKKKGTIKELYQVKDEIKVKLTLEYLSEELNDIVEQMKQKYVVEKYINKLN